MDGIGARRYHSPMRLTVAALTAAALAALPARARAQATPQTSRLLFSVEPNDPAAPAPAAAVRLDYSAAEGCPAEKELREIVAARMGHDPFAPSTAPAPFLLRTAVVRQGDSFVATVELRDASGRVLWSRPPLAEADCRRLVAVIGGVTVTIAIDTASAQAPAAPQPLPEVVPPLPVGSPPVAAPPSTSIPMPTIRLGVRAGAALGVGPAPTAAISADLGAGWKFFSIAVEGRADVPVTGDVSMGVSARTSVVAASLVPCGHYGYLVGCGLVSFGVLRAEGVNVVQPASDSGLYAAAGLRAGLEWPIVAAVALRLSADALVNLHPLAAQVDFQMGRADVWRSSAFATVLGGGVVVRFGGAGRL
jgi:hypothetical protein